MNEDNLKPIHLGQEQGNYLNGIDNEELDKPFVLYLNRKKILEGHNSRYKLGLIGNFLICGLMLIAYPGIWWMPISNLALTALIYICIRRAYSYSISPVIETHSNGLSIRSLYVNLFIPWNEIKEVRSFHFFEQNVGIVPIDFKKTLERGTMGTKLFCWSNALCMQFFQLFSVFLAPIYISEEELPLSAIDVAKQIELRRIHALQANKVIESEKKLLE